MMRYRKQHDDWDDDWNDDWDDEGWNGDRDDGERSKAGWKEESGGRGNDGFGEGLGGDVFVPYVPRILRNMKEICSEMGVCSKVVRRWVSSGAPIAVEGRDRRVRYSAEAARLQLWRERGRRSGTPRDST